MLTAPASVLAEINGLYVALYGRAADEGGLTYWIGALEAYDPSAGYSLGSTISTADSIWLGQQFISVESTYFNSVYSTDTPQQFVQALYQNIGGNAGDDTGVTYWTTMLTNAEAAPGATTQSAEAGIVGLFVNTMLSIDLTVGAAALGLSPQQYADAVARQETLLNKVAVSEFYAEESNLPNGGILAVPRRPLRRSWRRWTSSLRSPATRRRFLPRKLRSRQQYRRRASLRF